MTNPLSVLPPPWPRFISKALNENRVIFAYREFILGVINDHDLDYKKYLPTNYACYAIIGEMCRDADISLMYAIVQIPRFGYMIHGDMFVFNNKEDLTLFSLMHGERLRSKLFSGVDISAIRPEYVSDFKNCLSLVDV